jgi:hypothetical protein
MDYIINSYRRGRTSSLKKQLRPVSTGAACYHLGRRLPRHYLPADSAADSSVGAASAALQTNDAITFEALGGEDEGESTSAGVVEYMPAAMPAAHGKEYYSVLKFYSLSPHAVRHILAHLDYAGANRSVIFPGIEHRGGLAFSIGVSNPGSRVWWNAGISR